MYQRIKVDPQSTTNFIHTNKSCFRKPPFCLINSKISKTKVMGRINNTVIFSDKMVKNLSLNDFLDLL